MNTEFLTEKVEKTLLHQAIFQRGLKAAKQMFVFGAFGSLFLLKVVFQLIYNTTRVGSGVWIMTTNEYNN